MLAQHFRLLCSEQYHIRPCLGVTKAPRGMLGHQRRWYNDPSALEGVDHILHLPRLSFYTRNEKYFKTMSGTLFAPHAGHPTLIGRNYGQLGGKFGTLSMQRHRLIIMVRSLQRRHL